ncbi:MAG TPA: FAD-dependent oxidoreductase [Arenicellales bacterium]|nr:FAD-dependent oxidoreductase [Arenicellales bacterium]
MSEAEPTADVVIVGGGGAGLAAALSAARLGRRVTLLEKAPRIGGTTALSVGSITASCTPHQSAAGVDDSTQSHFDDMEAIAGADAGRDNRALRRLYVEEAPATVNFLSDLGVVFLGPLPEDVHSKPRMHVAVPDSRAYLYHLLRHCRRAGVRIVTGARVESLATDHGRVTGVVADVDGERRTFDARRGVVLASGDFSSGSGLKERMVAPGVAAIDGINPRSTGDGQRMAMDAGATVVNGDIVWGPEIRFVPPSKPSLVTRVPPLRIVARGIAAAMRRLPDRLMRPFLMRFVTTYLAPSLGLFEKGAFLVNREGRRFCDERDHPELAIPEQPGGEAFIVLDAALASELNAWPNFISTAPGVAYAYLADYQRNRSDICRQGDDIEDLASRCGIDPAGLKETLAQTSTDGAGAQAPYHILGPVRSWILLTEGGLNVDTRLRVLDENQQPIPGLFAAGSAGQGGLLLGGHGHHLGWAFTSGRIAGHSAACAATPTTG